MQRALNYNEQKVQKGKAQCVHAANYILEHEQMNFYQKLQRMEGLIIRNERTKKTNTLHISLNFHPDEKLSNKKLIDIADTYMARLGFKEQPYLVYRHYDAGHPHVHILTTTIQPDGKRINTFNIGKNQSEKARKEIEKEFNLISATTIRKNEREKSKHPTPAVYGKSETKQAIANVLKNTLTIFNYTNLSELNAILGLYNVKADRGKEGSITFRKNGLYYHLLDRNSKYIGVPIKASLFGSNTTLKFLEQRFEINNGKRLSNRYSLKKAIDLALTRQPRSLGHLIAMLQTGNIKTVLRKNEEGRVYGITFIDMNTKAVFNGSDIGKAYSIAALQKSWVTIAPGKNNDAVTDPKIPNNAIGINNYNEQRTVTGDTIPAQSAKDIETPLDVVTVVEKDFSRPPFELMRKKKRKQKKLKQ